MIYQWPKCKIIHKDDPANKNLDPYIMLQDFYCWNIIMLLTESIITWINVDYCVRQENIIIKEAGYKGYNSEGLGLKI